MTIEELRGIVAQGWTTERNSHKEMDVDLAEDIVRALWEQVFTEGGAS